jgi:hypothetical protein
VHGWQQVEATSTVIQDGEAARQEDREDAAPRLQGGASAQTHSQVSWEIERGELFSPPLATDLLALTACAVQAVRPVMCADRLLDPVHHARIRRDTVVDSASLVFGHCSPLSLKDSAGTFDSVRLIGVR